MIMFLGGVALVVWLVLQFGLINPGLPTGYWGQFNRARALIRDVDDVDIVNVRLNRDITLEDFTFDLVVKGTIRASLGYHENRPEWEALTSADGLLLHIDYGSKREQYCVSLADGGWLESALGQPCRSGKDVLESLDAILECVVPAFESSEQECACRDARISRRRSVCGLTDNSRRFFKARRPVSHG
jgi:hypothetical protein